MESQFVKRGININVINITSLLMLRCISFYYWRYYTYDNMCSREQKKKIVTSNNFIWNNTIDNYFSKLHIWTIDGYFSKLHI